MKKSLIILTSLLSISSLVSCEPKKVNPSELVPPSEEISEEESEIISEEPSEAEESELISEEPESEEEFTSYDLRLSINPGILGEGFHDIQFVYNYTNQTTNASYDWNNKISSSKESSYTYTVSNLDISKPLYFKIYMWDSSLGDIFVGDTDNKNFVYTPRNRAVEDVVITFTYPTEAGNVVGTYELLTPINPSTTMSHEDMNIGIYDKEYLLNPSFNNDPETFVATYEGNDIRIDDNLKVVGLKSNTTTKVTLTSEKGLTCSFNVVVKKSNYKATSARDSKWASSEKWFSSNEIEEISTLGQDFMNGFDISSSKALYDNGSKFFNKDGVEQSLFYIIKDAGINWVRLKVFHDPYTGNGTSYGAGEGNVTNALWMAHEAKMAGLKFLLDIHYSDYWTHPGQQILPKAWKNVSSSDELASLIEDYTEELLNTFKDNDVLPDMVQLGNEISSGNFLQKPGNDSETFNSEFENTYVTGKSNLGNDIKGTSGSENMIKYLSAASRGVNKVDANIKKVIHWAKGSSISAAIINNFFNFLSSVDYDYAGLSLYPYYCFPTGVKVSDGGIDVLNDMLSNLNISKPWFVAEISYPFSGSSWVYENDKSVTNFIVNDWSTNANIKDIETMKENFPFTPAGQADLLREVTYSVNKYNGLGIFYWEPAWIPNIKVGWSGNGSPCSWSNQGFFSYDGKAIGNLDIFAQMSPFIN